MEERRPTRSSRLASAFGASVTWLRFILILAIAAATAWVVVNVKPQEESESDVISMVPSDAKALQAQRRAAELFAVPFCTDAVVVQRAPSGISLDEQKATFDSAVQTDQAAQSGEGPRLVAVPGTNTEGVVPGSLESSTFVLTYLAVPESDPLVDRVTLAHQYAGGLGPDASVVGVTGVAPAELHEGSLIEDS